MSRVSAGGQPLADPVGPSAQRPVSPRNVSRLMHGETDGLARGPARAPALCGRAQAPRLLAAPSTRRPHAHRTVHASPRDARVGAADGGGHMQEGRDCDCDGSLAAAGSGHHGPRARGSGPRRSAPAGAAGAARATPAPRRIPCQACTAPRVQAALRTAWARVALAAAPALRAAAAAVRAAPVTAARSSCGAGSAPGPGVAPQPHATARPRRARGRAAGTAGEATLVARCGWGSRPATNVG